MTWAIRPIEDHDPDLAALVAVVGEVTPDDATSVDEIRWSDATYPGTGRFRGPLADGAGQPGAG